MFERFAIRKTKLETVNEAGKQARGSVIRWCKDITGIIRKVMFPKEVWDLKTTGSDRPQKLAETSSKSFSSWCAKTDLIF
jgi:hypothetical protein